MLGASKRGGSYDFIVATNVTMLGALGKMNEWEIHCRGAITNGVTKKQLRTIIHIIGIYCGVPQSLECFRVAKKVMEEAGLE